MSDLAVLLIRALPALVAAAVLGCIARGLWILLRYVPVEARFIGDAFSEARRARDAAVFHGERAPLPPFVSEEVVFTDAAGATVRTRARRPASPRNPSPLIWYAPNDPRHISLAGPLGWFVRAAALSLGFLLV